MGEDRTAAAALAIERYVAGLRGELALLGPSASGELIHEIRDVLLDAAKEDPERAFAEMQRLGEPSHLAAALLAERGVAPAGGIPSAEWWRMGIAAVIDIVVGLAAPVLIVVSLWGVTATALADGGIEGIVLAVALVGALALTIALTWRYWAPWRRGGGVTPGMAVTRIAVIRLGDARTVASAADLRRAGLETPAIKATSPGMIASVLLAVLFLAWAVAAVSSGAPETSSAGVVGRYAGSTSSQKDSVSYYVMLCYEAASSDPGDVTWPPISTGDFSTPPEGSFTATLNARFGGTGDVETSGYRIEDMSSPTPGVWTVKVAETPANAPARVVRLTYALRIEWNSFQGVTPRTEWVLSDYVVQ
jgi:hypothetical protein